MVQNYDPARPHADFGQTALSVAQVAVRWDVSARHIYDLCARGELGHLRIGGLIRVRLADLEAYEASRWARTKLDTPNHCLVKRGSRFYVRWCF
jgi:excisionase family DNA binding protein